MVATALKRLRLQEESRGPTEEAEKAFYFSHVWDPLFMFEDLLRIKDQIKQDERFAKKAPAFQCRINRHDLQRACSKEDYIALQDWLRERAIPGTLKHSREWICEGVLGGWSGFLKVSRSDVNFED